MPDDFAERVLEHVEARRYRRYERFSAEELAEAYRAGLEDRLPDIDTFRVAEAVCRMQDDEEWQQFVANLRVIHPDNLLPWEVRSDRGVVTRYDQMIEAYEEWTNENG